MHFKSSLDMNFCKYILSAACGIICNKTTVTIAVGSCLTTGSYKD